MSKQCASELMATEMVSIKTFFLKRNYSYGTRISVNLVDICSKPTICILIEFDTGFFSYLFYIDLFGCYGITCTCACMFHNFYFSLLWSLPVNAASNTFPNSTVKY